MLKIKDNVDLKELEKFGFYSDESIDDGEYYYWKYNIFIGKDRLICQDDGINHFKKTDYKFIESEIEVLYDLIQARFSRKSRGVINNDK